MTESAMIIYGIIIKSLLTQQNTTYITRSQVYVDCGVLLSFSISYCSHYVTTSGLKSLKLKSFSRVSNDSGETLYISPPQF